MRRLTDSLFIWKIWLSGSQKVSKIDADGRVENFTGFWNIAWNPPSPKKKLYIWRTSCFFWIFPGFFSHLRTRKSVKNMMRAGDVNRTIFRWMPNWFCCFTCNNKHTADRELDYSYHLCCPECIFPTIFIADRSTDPYFRAINDIFCTDWKRYNVRLVG